MQKIESLPKYLHYSSNKSVHIALVPLIVLQTSQCIAIVALSVCINYREVKHIVQVPNPLL
jgi:hypothetical protein